MVGPKFLFGPTIWVKQFSLIWRENGREGVSLFDEKLLMSFPLIQCCCCCCLFFHPILHSIFSPLYNIKYFFLRSRGIEVNLYNLHFLFSHFSSQSNKRVFYLYIFPSLQLNSMRENQISFILFVSSPSPFSIASIFRPNQMDPTSEHKLCGLGLLKLDINFDTKLK